MLFLGDLDDAGAVAKVVIALVAKQGDLCQMVAKPSVFEQSIEHLIDQFAEDVHRTPYLTPASINHRGRLSSIRGWQQEA